MYAFKLTTSIKSSSDARMMTMVEVELMTMTMETMMEKNQTTI
jgi:hypothetical protein